MKVIILALIVLSSVFADPCKFTKTDNLSVLSVPTDNTSYETIFVGPTCPTGQKCCYESYASSGTTTTKVYELVGNCAVTCGLGGEIRNPLVGGEFRDDQHRQDTLAHSWYSHDVVTMCRATAKYKKMTEQDISILPAFANV